MTVTRSFKESTPPLILSDLVRTIPEIVVSKNEIGAADLVLAV